MLQERMNRLFEDSLARTRLDPPLASGWAPAADAWETSDAFVVVLELPGVEQEDVEIQVDLGELNVRGGRRLPSPTRPDSFHRMERSYGPFSRRFQFDEAVDPERVVAQFRDGVLRLELPKLRPRTSLRKRAESDS